MDRWMDRWNAFIHPDEEGGYSITSMDDSSVWSTEYGVVTP